MFQFKIINAKQSHRKVPHRSLSSQGLSRSTSVCHIDPSSRPGLQPQDPIRPTGATSRATDLYHLPSTLEVQTPPPAYDLNVCSGREPVPSPLDRLAQPSLTGTAQSQQDGRSTRSTNARVTPRGPRRPMLPARSNSEFLPYSTHYYFIRTDDHRLGHPIHPDHTQSPNHHQVHQPSDSAPIKYQLASSKRKVNKLKKPRPVPPQSAHHAQGGNEVYQRHDNLRTAFDSPPSRPPLTNSTRLSHWILKQNSKRPEGMNRGLTRAPSQNVAASRLNTVRRLTSREFRDEKRLALLDSDANDENQPLMTPEFNICLNCQWMASPQNQPLNLHIHLDQSSVCLAHSHQLVHFFHRQ